MLAYLATVSHDLASLAVPTKITLFVLTAVLINASVVLTEEAARVRKEGI